MLESTALLRRVTFCFSSQPPERRVKISPRSQRRLSHSPSPRQGLLLVARGNIPERLVPTWRRAKERHYPLMLQGCAVSAGSRIIPCRPSLSRRQEQFSKRVR